MSTFSRNFQLHCVCTDCLCLCMKWFRANFSSKSRSKTVRLIKVYLLHLILAITGVEEVTVRITSDGTVIVWPVSVVPTWWNCCMHGYTNVLSAPADLCGKWKSEHYRQIVYFHLDVFPYNGITVTNNQTRSTAFSIWTDPYLLYSARGFGANGDKLNPERSALTLWQFWR